MAPGPDQCAASSRLALRLRDRLGRGRRVGRHGDRAEGAVDHHHGPGGDRVQPVTATTQGMPSWRAMIAVWLVGPPSVVASATTSAGSRPGGVGRGQVLGAQDRRHVGQRDAGFGQAAEFGDDAVADVLADR